MNPTRRLRDLGQSLWLDNIRRDMFGDGTLVRYIDDFGVSGLTSNPTIFENAIKRTPAYDAAIRSKQGKSPEALFFDLAIEDLARAADLFRQVHEDTNRIDGWVSLEVSPLLAYDTATTLAEAQHLHARAGRRNLFIKIPGTPQGVPAIEEAIFAGVPINVTLIFSLAQYLAAAEAFTRGIERRIEAGLNPEVASVASLFVSRWDVAVAAKVPPALHNRLGVAMAKRIFRAYRRLLGSARWQRIFNLGGRPQRLLFASTGTKDPHASDVLYVRSLAAPFTIDTMPEATLQAFAAHGELDAPLDPDDDGCESVIAEFERAGIDVDALGEQLQQDGAAAFVKSWNELLAVIETKAGLAKAR
ncbi:MAG TPA: transaldolase [Myxococcota bacterium]|nr:transaldolase [Myxococcota bacterium]